MKHSLVVKVMTALVVVLVAAGAIPIIEDATMGTSFTIAVTEAACPNNWLGPACRAAEAARQRVEAAARAAREAAERAAAEVRRRAEEVARWAREAAAAAARETARRAEEARAAAQRAADAAAREIAQRAEDARRQAEAIRRAAEDAARQAAAWAAEQARQAAEAIRRQTEEAAAAAAKKAEEEKKRLAREWESLNGRITGTSPGTFRGGQSGQVNVAVQNNGGVSGQYTVCVDSKPAGWSVPEMCRNTHSFSTMPPNATTQVAFSVTAPNHPGSGTIRFKVTQACMAARCSGSDWKGLSPTFDLNVAATKDLEASIEGWDGARLDGAAKGDVITARVRVSYGEAGQYTVRLRRDKVGAPDETVAERSFFHGGGGTQTPLSLAFAVGHAKGEDATEGFHLDLLKGSSTVWTLANSFPPRLKALPPKPAQYRIKVVNDDDDALSVGFKTELEFAFGHNIAVDPGKTALSSWVDVPPGRRTIAIRSLDPDRGSEETLSQTRDIPTGEQVTIDFTIPRARLDGRLTLATSTVVKAGVATPVKATVQNTGNINAQFTTCLDLPPGWISAEPCKNTSFFSTMPAGGTADVEFRVTPGRDASSGDLRWQLTRACPKAACGDSDWQAVSNALDQRLAVSRDLEITFGGWQRGGSRVEEAAKGEKLAAGLDVAFGEAGTYMARVRRGKAGAADETIAQYTFSHPGGTARTPVAISFTATHAQGEDATEAYHADLVMGNSTVWTMRTGRLIAAGAPAPQPVGVVKKILDSIPGLQPSTPYEKGKWGEEALFGKPSDRTGPGIPTSEGRFYPDNTGTKYLYDVKNRQYVGYTENLPKLIEAAKKTGKTPIVYVRKDATVAQRVLDEIRNAGGKVIRTSKLPTGVSPELASLSTKLGSVTLAISLVDIGVDVAEGDMDEATEKGAGLAAGLGAGWACAVLAAPSGPGALLAGAGCAFLADHFARKGVHNLLSDPPLDLIPPHLLPSISTASCFGDQLTIQSTTLLPIAGTRTREAMPSASLVPASGTTTDGRQCPGPTMGAPETWVAPGGGGPGAPSSLQPRGASPTLTSVPAPVPPPAVVSQLARSNITPATTPASTNTAAPLMPTVKAPRGGAPDPLAVLTAIGSALGIGGPQPPAAPITGTQANASAATASPVLTPSVPILLTEGGGPALGPGENVRIVGPATGVAYLFRATLQFLNADGSVLTTKTLSPADIGLGFYKNADGRVLYGYTGGFRPNTTTAHSLRLLVEIRDGDGSNLPVASTALPIAAPASTPSPAPTVGPTTTATLGPSSGTATRIPVVIAPAVPILLTESGRAALTPKENVRVVGPATGVADLLKATLQFLNADGSVLGTKTLSAADIGLGFYKNSDGRVLYGYTGGFRPNTTAAHSLRLLVEIRDSLGNNVPLASTALPVLTPPSVPILLTESGGPALAPEENVRIVGPATGVAYLSRAMLQFLNADGSVLTTKTLSPADIGLGFYKNADGRVLYGYTGGFRPNTTTAHSLRLLVEIRDADGTNVPVASTALPIAAPASTPSPAPTVGPTTTATLGPSSGTATRIPVVIAPAVPILLTESGRAALTPKENVRVVGPATGVADLLKATLQFLNADGSVLATKTLSAADIGLGFYKNSDGRVLYGYTGGFKPTTTTAHSLRLLVEIRDSVGNRVPLASTALPVLTDAGPASTAIPSPVAPTATPTATATATPTATATSSPTATPTATATATPTATATSSPTATPTATATATATSSPTATPTATATARPTNNAVYSKLGPLVFPPCSNEGPKPIQHTMTFAARVQFARGTDGVIAAQLAGQGNAGDSNKWSFASVQGRLRAQVWGRPRTGGIVFWTDRSVNDGLEHHVALTYRDTDGVPTIYVDGVKAQITRTENGDRAEGAWDDSPTTLQIGCSERNNDPFTGRMGDIQIFNVVRTSFPEALPTPTPAPPSPTPAPPTATPVPPTATRVPPTATAIPPTPTNTPVPVKKP